MSSIFFISSVMIMGFCDKPGGSQCDENLGFMINLEKSMRQVNHGFRINRKRSTVAKSQIHDKPKGSMLWLCLNLSW